MLRGANTNKVRRGWTRKRAKVSSSIEKAANTQDKILLLLRKLVQSNFRNFGFSLSVHT
jgi:hypothetical protein